MQKNWEKKKVKTQKKKKKDEQDSNVIFFKEEMFQQTNTLDTTKSTSFAMFSLSVLPT